MRLSKLIGIAALTLLMACPVQAERIAKRNKAPRSEDAIEKLDEQIDTLNKNSEGFARFLNSGDAEDDVTHYHSLSSRVGVDIGMMIPFGDYATTFSYSPLIGFHMAWNAIPPFLFTVGWYRSSSPDKASTNAKLTVSGINIGTQASFPMKRFSPFVKLESSFQFNDINFNSATKLISQGNDYNLTSFGINAGIGVDIVVGREISVGLDVTYHYAIPKKLLLSDSTNFDLASPFITTGLRLNF